MKRISFIFVTCLVIYSCTFTPQADLTLLLSKVDSLENRVKVLSHEKDSLSKIALRWKYGVDSVDDKGDKVNLFDFVRRSRLTFDASLLDTKLASLSSNSIACYENNGNNTTTYWFGNSISDDSYLVCTKFEADRFNYLISVATVNAYARYVYIRALERVHEDSDVIPKSSRKEALENTAGLIYRKMYNDLREDSLRVEDEIYFKMKSGLDDWY